MQNNENKHRRSALDVLALAESSIFAAMSFGLSYIILFEMPLGGSVTLCSLLPLILIAWRYGWRWGFSAAVVAGGLQMLQKFWAPPVPNVGMYALMISLDYLIAFGAMGCAAFFRRIKNGLLYAVPVCFAVRYACHVASGIIVWRGYAPEGWNPDVYSFAYNAAYIVPELIITLAAAAALWYGLPKKYLRERNIIHA